MARTKGVSAKEKFARTIEYSGAHVGKTASGKIYAVFSLDEASETRTPAESVSDAKSIIDSMTKKSRATDDPRKRGRRTKGVKTIMIEPEETDTPKRGRRTKGIKVKPFDPEKYRHLSHGGYRMCPPADCPHKCHWEGEPEQLFWVNNITCDGTCKKKEQCDHFKEFMKGQRRRIKLQSTERMEKECQFCKAAIREMDSEGSGEYHCGTTYNRLEGEYTRVCKPPKKEKPQKETKPKAKRRRTK